VDALPVRIIFRFTLSTTTLWLLCVFCVTDLDLTRQS